MRHGSMGVWIYDPMCMQNLMIIGELQREKKSEEWQSYNDEQKKEVHVYTSTYMTLYIVLYRP